MRVIEDADGAPLPEELQDGSPLWLSAFDSQIRVGYTARHAMAFADEKMIALAPIFYPNGYDS